MNTDRKAAGTQGRRQRRCAALVFTLVFATLIAGSILESQHRSASAHVPHPGLNFWIAVSGVSGCATRSGDSSCDLAPGSTFVVGVYLDSLPSDLPQYAGYDARLDYSGVTPNRDASSSPWPECRFPASVYETNDVVFGCAKGVPPAASSRYAGLLGTNSFVCTQSGNITLVHGRGNTDLVDDNIETHTEDPNTTNALAINCIQGGREPPNPTPGTYRGATGPPPLDATLEPTVAAYETFAAQSQATVATTPKAARASETPASGGAASSQSSGGGPPGWLIAVIVVGGVVLVGGAGAIGWRVMNRRGTSP